MVSASSVKKDAIQGNLRRALPEGKYKNKGERNMETQKRNIWKNVCRIGTIFIVGLATMSLTIGGVQALGDSISGHNPTVLKPEQSVNLNFTATDFSDPDIAAGTNFDVKIVRVVCVTPGCNNTDLNVVLNSATVSAANPTISLTVTMSANPISTNMSAYTVELSAGPNGPMLQSANATKSFRLILPSISGNKFEDKNGNGIWDAGEPGLSGWTIQLVNGGTVIKTTTTQTDGSYKFSGVYPGTYTVTEVLKSGWKQTAFVGTFEVKTDDVIGMNLGNHRLGCPTSVPAGTIAVCKYFDVNRNGVHDAGEPPMAGIIFDLLGLGNPIRMSATTDAAGVALFEGLAPGRYLVSERVSTIPQYMKITQGAGGYNVPGGSIVWFGNGCSPSHPDCSP